MPLLCISLDNNSGDSMKALFEAAPESDLNEKKASFLIREKDLLRVTLNMEEKKMAVGS